MGPDYRQAIFTLILPICTCILNSVTRKRVFLAISYLELQCSNHLKTELV